MSETDNKAEKSELGNKTDSVEQSSPKEGNDQSVKSVSSTEKPAKVKKKGKKAHKSYSEKFREVEANIKDHEEVLKDHSKKLNSYKFDFRKLNKRIKEISALKKKEKLILAASNSRKATEQICKWLYHEYGCAALNKGKPPDKLTLGALLDYLRASKQLDQQADNDIAYISKIGNFASHDQAQKIPERQLFSCIEAFEGLSIWFIEKYPAIEPLWYKIWRPAKYIVLIAMIFYIVFSQPAKDSFLVFCHYLGSCKTKSNLEKIKLVKLEQKKKQLITEIRGKLHGEILLNTYILRNMIDKLAAIDSVAANQIKRQYWNKLSKHVFYLSVKTLDSMKEFDKLIKWLGVVKQLISLKYFEDIETELVDNKIDEVIEYINFKKDLDKIIPDFSYSERVIRGLKSVKLRFGNTNNLSIIESNRNLIIKFLDTDYGLSLPKQLSMLNEIISVYDCESDAYGLIKQKINKCRHKISELTPELVKDIRSKPCSQLFKYLKEHSDLNVMDPYGNTALHVAVLENNKNWIKYLIAFGAKTNVKNYQGKTPLDLCVSDDDRSFLRKMIMNHENSYVVENENGEFLKDKANGEKSSVYIPFGLPVIVERCQNYNPGSDKWYKVKYLNKNGWLKSSKLSKTVFLNNEVMRDSELNNKVYFVSLKERFKSISEAKNTSKELLLKGIPNLVINLKNWELAKTNYFVIVFSIDSSRNNAMSRLEGSNYRKNELEIIEYKKIQKVRLIAKRKNHILKHKQKRKAGNFYSYSKKVATKPKVFSRKKLVKPVIRYSHMKKPVLRSKKMANDEAELINLLNSGD